MIIWDLERLLEKGAYQDLGKRKGKNRMTGFKWGKKKKDQG